MKNLLKRSYKRIKDFLTIVKQNQATSSLILTILILNLAITASFAWFAINRQTAANDMGMALKVDETKAVYKAYRYSTGDSAGTNLTAEGEELTLNNIVLNQYDTIFSGQNKNTPVFAQITITRNNSMTDDGKLYITITRRHDAGHEEELEAISSNIIRFTAFVLPDQSDVDKTTPEALYEHINTPERFKEVDGYSGNDLAYSKTFVTVSEVDDGTEYDIDNTLTLEVDYTSAAWYNDGKSLNLYLYITYDEDLIQCYLKEHGGGGISLDDTSVTYINDLKQVTISHS